MNKKMAKMLFACTCAFLLSVFGNAASAEELVCRDFAVQGEQFKRLSGSYLTGGYRTTNMNGRSALEIRTGIAARGTGRQYGVAFGDKNWDNYEISVDMKGHQFLTHSMGVIFNYQDGRNYYSLTWTNEKIGNIWAQIGPPKLRLCKGGVYDGTLLEETLFPNGVDPLLWHTYRITQKNETIYVYLDDRKDPIFKYKDSEYIKGGGIGLAVYSNAYASSPGYFDRLIVRK